MGIMIPGMQGAEDNCCMLLHVRYCMYVTVCTLLYVNCCMLLHVSAINIWDKGGTLSKEATLSNIGVVTVISEIYVLS